MLNEGKLSVKTIVVTGILTALVVVLQCMGAFVKLGMFSISLVLIPIVIGTATCGVRVGAWLGFVFGVVVLANGDAAPFLAVNVPGTVITVLLKGTLCGLASGLTYKGALRLFGGRIYPSSIIAAVVCPIVNTGIFLLGCLVFFMDTITIWAEAAGFGNNAAQYMIVGLVGINFVIELAVNIVLSPIIVRIIKATERS